jgi:hypothetical protein
LNLYTSHSGRPGNLYPTSGGGGGTPSETALEGAVEGSATDVISMTEPNSAATATESPTETAF